MKKNVLFIIFLVVFGFTLPGISIAGDWKIINIYEDKAMCDRNQYVLALRDTGLEVEFLQCVKHFQLVQLMDHFQVGSEESLIWREFGESDIGSPHIYLQVQKMKEARSQAKKILKK